jgi:hypothetical protein
LAIFLLDLARPLLSFLRSDFHVANKGTHGVMSLMADDAAGGGHLKAGLSMVHQVL